MNALRIHGVILVFIGLLIGFPTRAATFGAGQENLGKKTSEGTSATHSEVSDDALLKRLWSPKAFETVDALRALSARLPQLVGKEIDLNQAVKRALWALTADSPNVRAAANEFFKTNGALLFSEKLLDDSALTALSADAQTSELARAQLISLLDALLPNAGTQHITPESVFQTIDALNARDPHIRTVATHLIEKNGPELADAGVWKIEHTQNFLAKFLEAKPSDKPALLPIMHANLNAWVGHVFITKEQFAKTFDVLGPQSTPDLRQAFVEFLRDPKMQPALRELGFFSPEWAQSLVDDIKTPDNPRKQVALALVTELMRPLVVARAFTGENFHAIWQTVSSDLAAFDAPFDVVSKNIEPLLKAGWFSQKDYQRLVDAFAKRPLGEQKMILAFLERHYDAFNGAGWVSATPLEPILLDPSDAPELRRLRATFLQKHADLVSEKKIFSRESLAASVKWLHDRDPETRNAALDVFEMGFDTWTADGTLDKPLLASILDTEPADARSARIIAIVGEHCGHNLALFDKIMLESLSEFAASPNERVTEAVTNFFVKNFETFKKAGLFTPKIRRNFEQAELWDEFPKKVRNRHDRRSR